MSLIEDWDQWTDEMLEEADRLCQSHPPFQQPPSSLPTTPRKPIIPSSSARSPQTQAPPATSRILSPPSRLPTTDQGLGFLSTLTPRQHEAVTTPVNQPIMILAGPGSGKTLTLVGRIAWLVSSGNVPARGILALTFTRKAAQEMRDRVSQLVGAEKASQMTIGTFHSFCLGILREFWETLGCFRKPFEVIDGDQQRKIIKELHRRSKLEATDTPSRRRKRTAAEAQEEREETGSLLKFIGRAKSENHRPADYQDKPEYGRIYQQYENYLASHDYVDFNDFLLLTLQLLQKTDAQSPLAVLQRRHIAVLVDEYQDTNRAQFDLIKKLVGYSQHLTVVGDIDQSIYGFRGASISNYAALIDFLPGTRILNLDQNFRSSKAIVALSQQLIAHNPVRSHRGTLWTANDDGQDIFLAVCQMPYLEAEIVAGRVEQLLKEGFRPRDIAILYRTRVCSHLFEVELHRRGIPFGIRKGITFYGRADIKDMIAFLRLIAIPTRDERNAGMQAPDRVTEIDFSFQRAVNASPNKVGKLTMDIIRNVAYSLRHTQGRAVHLLESATVCVDPARSEGKPNHPDRSLSIKQRQLTSLEKFLTVIRLLTIDSETLSLSKLIESIVDRVSYFGDDKEPITSAPKPEAGTIDAEDDEEEASHAANRSRRAHITLLMEEASRFVREETCVQPPVENEDQSPTPPSPRAILRRFLARIAVNDREERASAKCSGPADSPDLVMLSTIHQAKGLEFPAVFVVRMNEGVLPLPENRKKEDAEDEPPRSRLRDANSQAESVDHPPSSQFGEVTRGRTPHELLESMNGAQLDEERRLAYVALTRARYHLFMTCSLLDTSNQAAFPSRFLSEVPEGMVKLWKREPPPREEDIEIG